MKSCVNFHLLSKWIPILRAKLRKKLGRSLASPCKAGPELNTDGLGLGLGPLLLSSHAFFPSESRVERFFGHKFRILGTEWAEPMASAGYQPIDWKPEYGKRSSEDIKLPWELSRFHGFAEMAYFAQGKDAAWVDRIATEILNQIRDFSTANRAGHSVHWGCAMDVSLRAINIIVALELLKAAGWKPSNQESRFLAEFLREHGRFVYRNLEWYRVGRGNHYLTNLVGLLACSLWLNADRETRSWLRFAALELEIEAERQFLPDGSNFEGSVFYHRLSLELIALGYAFLLGPAQRKMQWHRDLHPLALKIQAGLQFLKDLTDREGHGVQIGDHDSGRALKLQVPEIEIDGRVFEDSLDTLDALSLASLFQGQESPGALGDVALWIAGMKLNLPETKGASSSPIFWSGTELNHPSSAIAYEFPIPFEGAASPAFGYYKNFGVYFWKNGPMELWLRCGPASNDGHGGHAHFDQLHLEIRVGGKYISFDPGSYTYTGNLSLRNQYRGPEVHFIPRLLEKEKLANNMIDAFRYPGLPAGECLFANENGFCGRYQLQEQRAYRKLLIEPGKIRIWDWCEGGTLLSQMPPHEMVSWGYGEQVRWPLSSIARNGKK